VIPELERLEAANASMNNTKSAIAKVLKMARKAAAEPHLYLSFLGD
jgi:glycine cleavage system pyridoxal-binding protein P